MRRYEPFSRVTRDALEHACAVLGLALGAKSFGFRVYWINRGGAPVDRLGFVPDRILDGLAAL